MDDWSIMHTQVDVNTYMINAQTCSNIRHGWALNNGVTSGKSRTDSQRDPYTSLVCHQGHPDRTTQILHITLCWHKTKHAGRLLTAITLRLIHWSFHQTQMK